MPTKSKGDAKRPAAKRPAAKGEKVLHAAARAKEDLYVENMKRPGATGREAVIAAGYSPKSAKQTAHRLFGRDDIRERIERGRQQMLEEAKVENFEVVGSLAQMMRGLDWAEIFPDDPVVRRLAEAGASSSRVVTSLKFDKDTRAVSQITTVDSKDAAKTLGVYAGLNRPVQMTPDEAQRDRENREWAEAQLGILMEEMKITREQALEIVRAEIPSMVQWVM